MRQIIYSDGSIFEGNYENDLKNGFGIYKDINGAYYEGEYKDDYMHGKGKYIWENGDIYEGTF